MSVRDNRRRGTTIITKLTNTGLSSILSPVMLPHDVLCISLGLLLPVPATGGGRIRPFLSIRAADSEGSVLWQVNTVRKRQWADDINPFCV